MNSLPSRLWRNARFFSPARSRRIRFRSLRTRIGTAPGMAGNGCPRVPFRVSENVQIRKGHRLDKLPRFFEQFIRFARKPHHHIRADRRVRHQPSRLHHPIRVMARPVFPVHPAQNRIRSRLQRRMHMFRDPRSFRHQSEQVVREIHRLDRAQAQALDFCFGEQSAQKIGQAHPTARLPPPSPEIDPRQHRTSRYFTH